MSASRKTGWFAALGLAAALVLGLGASSANAGHRHHHHHKFHHHGHFHKLHVVPHTPYVRYARKPIFVPVVYYDRFGQPYTVWKKIYRTGPFGF